MQESTEVRDAVLRFYERRTAADPASFEDLVAEDLSIMIGTGPGEWFEERETLRKHFSTPGLSVQPGDVRAWEEGSVGWFLDTPRLSMPDGNYLSTRVSGVVHKEGGRWKLMVAHFAVEVPDEIGFELSMKKAD